MFRLFFGLVCLALCVPPAAARERATAAVLLIGDTFSGDTFWHGTLMTRYAEDWVKLFTAGNGTFVMTDMEDTAFAEALQRLDRMHRVDEPVGRELVAHWPLYAEHIPGN
jgi:purine nucleoside permease